MLKYTTLMLNLTWHWDDYKFAAENNFIRKIFSSMPKLFRNT